MVNQSRINDSRPQHDAEENFIDEALVTQPTGFGSVHQHKSVSQTLTALPPSHAHVSHGCHHRPLPFLKKKVTPIVKESIPMVSAQDWMHTRFSNLTVDMFGTKDLVIYSLHDMKPPAGFSGIWKNVPTDQEHSLILSSSEIGSLEQSTAVLIFLDTKSEEHIRAAQELTWSIQDLQHDVPSMMLMPHSSTSPEMWDLDAMAAKESDLDLMYEELKDNVDHVITGEPIGAKMVCLVRSRFLQQAREMRFANCQIEKRKSRWEYADDLKRSLDDTVWNYCRQRLRSAVPNIDHSIGEGLPESIEGRFVGKKLGEGSYGTVCELKCPDGAEPEVLKLMDKSSMTNFEGISTLKRQIRIMLQLSEVNVHPNITQLYEVYHSSSHILFRMEYAGPQNLFKRLRSRDHGEDELPVDKACDVVLQCMDGLAHMHLVAHVAHRDLKPENIVVSETADVITVKITDFDTATFANSETSKCQGVIGTFPFIAPEVARLGVYKPFPADIWSMGMVMLEVLCGMNPTRRMLGQANPRGRSEARKEVQKIESFFSRQGHVKQLLDKCLRSELKVLHTDSITLIQGMLNVDIDERLTATGLASLADNLFASP